MTRIHDIAHVQKLTVDHPWVDRAATDEAGRAGCCACRRVFASARVTQYFADIAVCPACGALEVVPLPADVEHPQEVLAALADGVISPTTAALFDEPADVAPCADDDSDAA